jgi:hypothetical protein
MAIKKAKSAKASKPRVVKAKKKTSKGKLNRSEGEHCHTNVPRDNSEMRALPPKNPKAVPAADCNDPVTASKTERAFKPNPDTHPLAAGGPPEDTRTAKERKGL